jgi:tRNA(fMet)-specific endonuclease VapC
VSTLLVDTNIVSYAYNQHSLWTRYAPILEGNQVLVAAQTVAEMRFGALLKNWGEGKTKRLEALLASYGVAHTDDAICMEWGRVKNEALVKGRPMSLGDTWIAATARSLGIPLVTHNKKDFDFLDGLTVLSETQ